ncbi:NADH-quinone oxidoreductase subunit NuoE [Holophaga foetida]|uniref:NADH-quinone oxidoreductase subunit NuoE n=1 Tax=Holophaga foetida TaxID=35839 RepID=UPI0002471CE1|nr:NADH-quinone oxidoreductase subunit NuoE [Holophaga foetida]
MCSNVVEAPQSARQFAKVLQILASFGNEEAKLVPILQAVQEEYRYLPEEVMTFVATALGVPPARVYGVATFYGHFALEPKGKYVVRVCDGTACHVKGSQNLVETLRDILKLPEGKKTTPDMLFTLETVSCLGACGLAPAVVINEDVHGLMTPESTAALIEDIRREEGL